MKDQSLYSTLPMVNFRIQFCVHAISLKIKASHLILHSPKDQKSVHA